MSDRTMSAGSIEDSVVMLSDAQLDALADRIAARLQSPPASGGLVDAATLADRLGVARSFVYSHADELGGKRLSERGRLRFDLAVATAAFASRQPESRAAPRRRKSATRSMVGSILQVRA
jgi:hypothetical protein